jgi:polar amino acid transport system ATP-binding protein
LVFRVSPEQPLTADERGNSEFSSRKRKGERHIAGQRALTGMAFQPFNLFAHMAAAQNVMLGSSR